MFIKISREKQFNEQKVTQANRIQKHCKTKYYFHHFTHIYNCTYIQNQNAIRSQHTGILGVLLTDLLSKCWACSMRNWLPCSHCLSSNWSKLWGMLPTAVILLLFPEWLLVLLVELLAQLLLGITVVPTVPPCADPPGTLFALRTCIMAQSYSQWEHTDHV